MSQQIHEEILKLLEQEDPAIRKFLIRALSVALREQLSAQGLAVKLRRELAGLVKEDANED